MKQLSAKLLKEVCLKKGYKWFDDKVNIIGIRTSDMTPDIFNDFITVSWKDKVTGEYNFIGFEATTDPGLYYLRNPQRVEGTGILIPGQYLNCWMLGMHNGKYEALIQIGGAVRVYRDDNRDDYFNLDAGRTQAGYFGVNIHRAHANVIQKIIGRYSAACQVIRSIDSWNKFLAIIKASGQTHFTYTLITEADI